MLKKVKQKSYKSKREFKDDLDLIWSNCLTYNSTEVRHNRTLRRPTAGSLTRSAKNHPLRQCALRLQIKAERLLQNITDRKERIDPPLPPELAGSRGSTPRLNGVNGHVVGRARTVAFTKSPSPTKHLNQARREASPSDGPAFERTPMGMANFLRLDRELHARMNGPSLTNGISGPTLEEQLAAYPPLYSEGDRGDLSHTTVDGGLGEKRKL